MTPFLRINLCISVIALLISSVPAQATPMYFDVAHSFYDGSTSKFNFRYDPQNLELTDVSSVRIRDANGRITVPLEDFGVIPTDPEFGSSILVFIFNSLTTNVIEALAFNGQTGSFDEAAASLTDDRRHYIEQIWSNRVGDSNEGGDIKINNKRLGFVFFEREHEDEDDCESDPSDELPIASVPEPNIFVLLLAGLIGFSLTGQIRNRLSGKNTAKPSILAL
jgi:hypothetical protein